MLNNFTKFYFKLLSISLILFSIASETRGKEISSMYHIDQSLTYNKFYVGIVGIGFFSREHKTLSINQGLHKIKLPKINTEIIPLAAVHVSYSWNPSYAVDLDVISDLSQYLFAVSGFTQFFPIGKNFKLFYKIGLSIPADLEFFPIVGGIGTRYQLHKHFAVDFSINAVALWQTWAMKKEAGPFQGLARLGVCYSFG
jgi:hypothetical protein